MNPQLLSAMVVVARYLLESRGVPTDISDKACAQFQEALGDADDLDADECLKALIAVQHLACVLWHRKDLEQATWN